MILTELILAGLGTIFFLPSVIREYKENQLEPFFSLWLQWAEIHQDNDFPFAGSEDYSEPIHPNGWYDLEFERWLDGIGINPWDQNNFHKLCALERYLIKHKYIKRQCYWNHWIYQINKEKLF